jgi:hypothetical protein
MRRSDVHGRGQTPDWVIGSAVDEVGALVDLALRLDEQRKAANLRHDGRERPASLP